MLFRKDGQEVLSMWYVSRDLNEVSLAKKYRKENSQELQKICFTRLPNSKKVSVKQVVQLLEILSTGTELK